MPFSCPLPLSVPVTPDGIGAPVPSAGPYYIAGWTRNAEILVRENPNYAGGRPHHFDEIHYGIGLPLETIKLGIDAGTTDWGDIPPAAHAELGTRFGDCRPSDPPRRQRYLCYPAPTVHYLAMNHDRPLFGAGGPRGNVALKQAVNYAIDRTAMLEQRGAFAGEPTDQHLPVSLPGFRDADLYPARPDLTKARELAGCDPDCPPRQGVLYCSNRAPAPAICQIAQTNLRAIGIELEIKLFPRATQFELAGRRGEPFDMTLEAWHTEYLDQFSFFQLLDGTRIGPANNVNFAYFNDPDFNARIAAANQLRGSARETAFGLLDVDIARDAAPWAAYGVPNDRYYFSDRVGCQLYSPAYTVNLAALCLRPAISIGDVAITEGDSGTTSATFSVSLAEAAPGDYPVTISYATVDGTAGSSDYESAAGTVTFAEGETTKSISVPVSGDTVPEPAETFHVQLSAPTRGTVVRARGTARIVDDDADTTPPANPTSVASATHTPSTWSDDPYVEVTWSGASDDSEVAGYSIEWTEQPDSVPDGSIDLTETTVAEELDDGQSWFHVRAVDASGNPAVGAAHLGPFRIDATPPATRELASPTHTPEVWSTNTNVRRRRLLLRAQRRRRLRARHHEGRRRARQRIRHGRADRGKGVLPLPSRGQRRELERHHPPRAAAPGRGRAGQPGSAKHVAQGRGAVEGEDGSSRLDRRLGRQERRGRIHRRVVAASGHDPGADRRSALLRRPDPEPGSRPGPLVVPPPHARRRRKLERNRSSRAVRDPRAGRSPEAEEGDALPPRQDDQGPEAPGREAPQAWRQARRLQAAEEATEAALRVGRSRAATGPRRPASVRLGRRLAQPRIGRCRAKLANLAHRELERDRRHEDGRGDRAAADDRPRPRRPGGRSAAAQSTTRGRSRGR
jgi:hypothetical protein